MYLYYIINKIRCQELFYKKWCQLLVTIQASLRQWFYRPPHLLNGIRWHWLRWVELHHRSLAYETNKLLLLHTAIKKLFLPAYCVPCEKNNSKKECWQIHHSNIHIYIMYQIRCLLKYWMNVLSIFIYISLLIYTNVFLRTI